MSDQPLLTSPVFVLYSTKYGIEGVYRTIEEADTVRESCLNLVAYRGVPMFIGRQIITIAG
jgi:hypothetical protein